MKNTTAPSTGRSSRGHDMSHDRFFKAVFGEPEHAIAYFESYLPPKILAQADLSTATLCPGSFVDEQLSERHTDLLYQLQLAGRAALIYVLFEHQRSCEQAMMFRLLRYMVRIWEHWLKEHSISEGLPPIIPMVLYQGQQGWTAATRLSGLLAVEVRHQRMFRCYFPDFEMLLVDLSKLSDDHLKGTALGRLALHLLKNIDNPDLMSLLPGWLQTVRQIWRESGLNGLRLALDYLLQSSEHVSAEKLGALLATEVGAEAGNIAMTAADKLREEGSLQGRQAILLRQLEARFGELPGEAKDRVMSAGISQLDDWAVRVLSVSALDELLWT